MSDKSTGLFSGLVLGVAIGLVLGALFAPQAGDESRKVIRSRAQDSYERLRAAASDAQSTIKDQGLSFLRKSGGEVSGDGSVTSTAAEE